MKKVYIINMKSPEGRSGMQLGARTKLAGYVVWESLRHPLSYSTLKYDQETGRVMVKRGKPEGYKEPPLGLTLKMAAKIVQESLLHPRTTSRLEYDLEHNEIRVIREK